MKMTAIFQPCRRLALLLGSFLIVMAATAETITYEREAGGDLKLKVTNYDCVDGIYYQFGYIDSKPVAYVAPKQMKEVVEALNKEQFDLGNIYYTSAQYSGNLVIPATIQFEGVTYSVYGLSTGSLYECTELTGLSLPATLEYIDDPYLGAIYSNNEGPYNRNAPNGYYHEGPDSLTSITVDPANTVLDSRNSCNCVINTAENKVLLGCQNSSIPEGMQTIGYAAFINVPKGDLVLPNTVKEIEDFAFFGYEGKISLPNSIEEIGLLAFAHCKEIVQNYSFKLPTNLKHVEHPAFLWHRVVQTSATTSREENSVRWSSLYVGPYPFELDYDFDVNYSNCTLYVPKGCKKFYENAEFWKDFRNIIETTVYATEPSSYINAIYVNNVTQWPGKEVELPIRLKNNKTDIKGFQFDLELPEGVTLKQEDGKYCCTRTERTPEDFEFTIRPVGNKYRIMANSFTEAQSVIEEKDGLVMYITAQIAPTAPIGEQPVKTTNIKVAFANDETDTSIVNRVITNKMTIAPITIGDADGSDEVNVGDISTIVEALYGSVPDNYIQLAADIDGDGNVDVSDIIGIVDIIFSSTTNNAAARDAQTGSPFSMPDITIQAGESFELPVHLEGDASAINAFQFDINLPVGFSIRQSGIGEAYTEHEFRGQYLAKGGYRMVAFNLEGQTFGADAQVARMTIDTDAQLAPGTYTLHLSNALASGSHDQRYSQGTLATITVTETTGIEQINAENTVTDSYDMMGRKTRDTEHGVVLQKGQKSINY